MKPALFQYVAPDSLDAAIAELAGDDGARPLAGGQSLIPTLNFRLAAPSKLVDLRKIKALRGIRVEGNVIRVGAMTRHRELELDEAAHRANPLIREVLRNVAHIIVRNRGTIGGSLAHADASAELPCLLVATGGAVVARGAKGERTIAAEDFFRFHLTTALEPSEVLTEVRIPTLAPGAGYAFQEVARRHGDYALAGVCALVMIGSGGACTAARLAACGIAPTATRLIDAENALVGVRPGGSFEAAAHAARRYVTTGDDRNASTAFRQDLVATLVKRTVATAFTRIAR
jgi:carbon-monoxide dehydrogenase medium subunit